MDTKQNKNKVQIPKKRHTGGVYTEQDIRSKVDELDGKSIYYAKTYLKAF